MKKRLALVVDDDPMILEDVADRLDSLGHQCDCVGSQKDARRLLEDKSYDFVLLDLEIPVQYGRISRKQNGQNLLRHIRQLSGYESIPIIVITAHGHDSPDLATEVLRCNGADDFVKKPFPETGQTLEKAITDALKKQRRVSQATAIGEQPRPSSAMPRNAQPFISGDMVFFPDRIELCGVKILSDSGVGHSRQMLELLRQTRSNGRYVRLSGEQLAREVESNNGIGSITGCASTIRRNIKTRLKRDLNIECDPARDVLVRDEQGYHFNDEKITVRNGGDGEETEFPDGDKRSVPVNDPGDTEGDIVGHVTARGDKVGLNPRQIWVLEQVENGNTVQRSRFERRFEISTKTAKRDLSGLTRRDLIEYIHLPSPGHYRQKGTLPEPGKRT